MSHSFNKPNSAAMGAALLLGGLMLSLVAPAAVGPHIAASRPQSLTVIIPHRSPSADTAPWTGIATIVTTRGAYPVTAILLQ